MTIPATTASLLNRLSVRIIIILGVALVILSQLTSLTSVRHRISPYLYGSGASDLILLTPHADQPILYRHVVITSTFRGHSEVWASVAWALGRVMKRETTGDLKTSINLYAENPGFVDMLDKWGMLPGPIQTKERDHLAEDMARSDLIPDDPGAYFDMIIMGTCELDLPRVGEKLVAVWDARPAGHKFDIVCIVHNAANYLWFPSTIEWSRRGALRLMPISDHVAKRFHDMFAEVAGGTDVKLASAFQDHVVAVPYYPVSDLTRLLPAPIPAEGRVLTRVAVQGYYQQIRRDYERIFSDLKKLMAEDPSDWGYLPIDNKGSGAYEPNPAPGSHPFELHLVGGGEIEIPKELSKVVILDKGLGSIEFYTKLMSMDVMVPAFHKGGAYLFSQASSTVHTSVECRVPILGTLDMRASYPYLDDTNSIVRPHSISEMESIRVLRLNSLEKSQRLISQGPPQFARMLEEMLEKGWIRTSAQWEATLKRIWARNEGMLSDMIRGL